MVYQIYYNNGNGSRQVLFDIEIYMKLNETLYDKKEKKYTSDEKWYVEMHSDAFISGAVNFLREKFAKDLIHTYHHGKHIFDFIQFEKDCKELEELRGWLWETHSNQSRKEEDAEKDYDEWRVYVKDKVYAFARNYDLKVNED